MSAKASQRKLTKCAPTLGRYQACNPLQALCASFSSSSVRRAKGKLCSTSASSVVHETRKYVRTFTAILEIGSCRKHPLAPNFVYGTPGTLAGSDGPSPAAQQQIAQQPPFTASLHTQLSKPWCEMFACRHHTHTLSLSLTHTPFLNC